MVKFVLILFSVIIMYLSFLLSEKNPYNGESLGGKAEWANLKSIDGDVGSIQYLTEKLKIMRFNGSEILLYTEGNKKCAVLLNCEYPPYYKTMGQCDNTKLTKETFGLIKEYSHMSKTVEYILGDKVEPNKI